MTPSTCSRRFFLQFSGGLLIPLALSACRPSTETAPNKTLAIGVNTNNAPWGFEDESGQLVGFEVDLVQAIANSLGLTVELTDIPFIDLFPAVASGRIDIAMSSITITDERLETVAFSQPYYDSDQSLTVRAGSEVTGLNDLAGKVVAVNIGTTGEAWVDANQDRYKFGEIVRYERSFEINMDDLKEDLVDGHVTDIPAALFYTKTHTDLEVIEQIPTGEQYALMFAKGSSLQDEVNAAITELKEDGFLTEIHEKWFGKAPEPDSSTVLVLPMPEA